MGIPRPKETGELKKFYEGLIKELRFALTFRDQAEAEIRQAVEAIVSAGADRLLAELPVEELNRDKKGIRVKTLRDQGILTLYDVTRTSTQALEDIDGISPAGAMEIRAVAERLTDQARSQVKIRLSRDDRNPASTALLMALVKWAELDPLTGQCQALLEANQKPAEQCLEKLKPAASGFSWLFASGEKKRLALEAEKFLTMHKSQGFGSQGKELMDKFRQALTFTENQAWEKFERDSIGIYGILEKMIPGLQGKEDGSWGLPENLAHLVVEQELPLEGLRCQLRRYQAWGVKYILKQKKVLLGDEMGLGKTVQAIAAMVCLRNQGQTHFMVVCPASVLENWVREIQKHSDLKPLKLHGSERPQALEQWLANGGVAVTTYESTGQIQLPREIRLGLLVVDEAHYIKNLQTQRSQNVRRLMAQGENILLMTGTALENRVEEMLTLMDLLQPEAAADARKLATFAGAPMFREAAAPVYYRRKREDVLTELPDLIEKQQWLVMTDPERQAYEQAVLEHHFPRARRVSWTAPGFQVSSKAQRLLELADQAKEEGRKIIVFSSFLETLSQVAGLLGDRCLPAITGSVPPEKRQEIIDSFENAPAGAVLPAQIQAGGTGLNIQCASVVILCEPQLKPSIENQAISRAYRMGQTRNVLVHRLLCEDSIDERITQVLQRKQMAFDAFADESAAADQSREVDEKTAAKLMDQEAARIAATGRRSF